MRSPVHPLFLPGPAASSHGFFINLFNTRPSAATSGWQARRVFILGLIALALTVSVCGRSPAQTESTGHIVIKREPAPLAWQWYAFLNSVSLYERLADQRELQGQDGTPMRTSYQRSLNFTDEEFEPIRTSALRLDAKLKELDAQAKGTIDADRAANPMPPDMVESRRQFSRQRAEVIEREIASLQAALGPGPSAALDAYVQAKFSRRPATGIRHPDGTTPPPFPVTRTQMYERFLWMVNNHDQAAPRLQMKGGNGRMGPTDYQMDLGFTDQQYAQVRSTAQRLDVELKEMFSNELGAQKQLHPAPFSLQALSRERQAAINEEVYRLQQILGLERTAIVERYIQTHFHSARTVVEHHPDGNSGATSQQGGPGN